MFKVQDFSRPLIYITFALIHASRIFEQCKLLCRFHLYLIVRHTSDVVKYLKDVYFFRTSDTSGLPSSFDVVNVRLIDEARDIDVTAEAMILADYCPSHIDRSFGHNLCKFKWISPKEDTKMVINYFKKEQLLLEEIQLNLSPDLK